MRPRLDTRELCLVLSACATLAILILLSGVSDPGAPDGTRSAALLQRPWLDALGITLAGCGTYVLARVLGLERVGASLAAVGYASSGCSLGSLSDRAPLSSAVLPWLLIAVEAVRRTSGRMRWWAIVLTTLVSTWNLVGAVPGTSVCNALCAACWSLSLWGRDRRAALWSAVGLALGLIAAAPFLAPLVEELQTTTVSDATRPHGGLDFLALACWVFLILSVSWWRDSRARDEAVPPRRLLAHALVPAATVVACAVGLAFFLGRRGDSPAAALVLCPDLFGVPARSGTVGSSILLASLHAWLPLAIVAAASVSFLNGRGVLVRRAETQALAAVFTLVAVHAPGIVDLWRALPILSWIDAARAAGVGTLMLALLAGEALHLGDRVSRYCVAALCFGLTVTSVMRPVHRIDPTAMADVYGAADPADEIIGWIERPTQPPTSARARVVAWVHPALPAERVILRVDRLDERGASIANDARELAATWADAASASMEGLPAGARVLRTADVDLTRLRAGVWRFQLEFYRRGAGSDERPIGARTAALVYLADAPRLSISTACMLLATVIFLCLPRWNGPAAWGVVMLAALQALQFAHWLRLVT